MVAAESEPKRMIEGGYDESERMWKILRIIGWSGAALVMLLPLVAMPFTDEVDWSIGDFIFAAIILGGTGLAFELAIRRSRDNAYRTGIVLALVAAFLLIWSNAAVGFIGAGANAANILYAAMLAIPIIGGIVAGFRANGMSITMIVTALVQASITIFAFASDLVQEDEKVAIMAINGVFIALWVGSAMLFHQAAQRSSSAQSVGPKRGGQVHFLLSILMIVIGGLLMVYMITVESEPGALPLLLILLGTGWFFFTLFRSRSHQRWS